MGTVSIDPEGADDLASKLDDVVEELAAVRSAASGLGLFFPLLRTWAVGASASGLAGTLRTAAAIARDDENLPSGWADVAVSYDLGTYVDADDVRTGLAGYADLDLDELEALLDLARGAELAPTEYADALESYWQRRALERAGIDPDAWDPSRGAEANRDIIEAVYEYYADVYGEDDNLIWAGMANMIGPSFAAGFFDLAEFRDIAQQVEGNSILRATFAANPVLSGLNSLLAGFADFGDDELAYYETTFLTMQKDIFFDLGPAHEAYLAGGWEAVQEMADAGIIDPSIAEAFTKIDEGTRTGDTALIEEGNRDLLLREQREVIDDYYQEMKNHDPTGELVTKFMTLIGAPSIPGAKGYPEVFGFDGNIADFDDRWALIEEDTLPAFLELWRNDREQANEIIASPVGPRINDYRMKERFPFLKTIIDGPSVEISLPGDVGIEVDLPSPIDILFPPLPF